ncbi:hypothetical protein [Variovorax atrisoli]|uniref:hypothetical protein n=1 Tax=Variovorax atrisoli TaxID=3394203 RepID=UPI00037898DE|nr:hypothetical protein [Variovorax paradoxus]
MSAAQSKPGRRPTVSAEWLESAAAELESSAEGSLPTWVILGQAHRYCEDLGKAAMLRKAAGIKSVADRREFLRANGVEA